MLIAAAIQRSEQELAWSQRGLQLCGQVQLKAWDSKCHSPDPPAGNRDANLPLSLAYKLMLRSSEPVAE